jgi:hypothetical protein
MKSLDNFKVEEFCTICNDITVHEVHHVTSFPVGSITCSLCEVRRVIGTLEVEQHRELKLEEFNMKDTPTLSILDLEKEFGGKAIGDVDFNAYKCCIKLTDGTKLTIKSRKQDLLIYTKEKI